MPPLSLSTLRRNIYYIFFFFTPPLFFQQLQLTVWLTKIFPRNGIEHVTSGRLYHKIKTILNHCSSATEDEAELFLSEDYDFHSLPPPLSSLGLNRLHLLDHQVYELKNRESEISNAVVIALEKFRSKEQMSSIFVRKWLRILCPQLYLTDSQLHQRVKKAIQNYRKIMRGTKPHLKREFLDSTSFINSIKNVEIKKPETCAACTILKRALKEKERMIHALTTHNVSLQKTNNDIKQELHIKNEIIDDLQQEIKTNRC